MTDTAAPQPPMGSQEADDILFTIALNARLAAEGHQIRSLHGRPLLSSYIEVCEMVEEVALQCSCLAVAGTNGMLL